MCVPQVTQVHALQLSPKDMLVQLANILTDFNGINRTSMSFLQQKMIDCGLGVPQVSRFTELPDDSIRSQDTDSPSGAFDSLYMHEGMEQSNWLMHALDFPPTAGHCPDLSPVITFSGSL